jgi:anti-sigma regulatory factor (Ser/Thr protein kinase)
MSADPAPTTIGMPNTRMAVLDDLTDESTACADGRRFVGEHLARWSVPAQVSDEAVLLTSELIANAIRHAPPPLCLQVSVDDSVVRVQMHDSNPVAPVLTRPDFTSRGGRGVWLIDTLAAQWGVRAQPPGKEVWFEIILTPRHDQSVLPDGPA